MSESSTNEFQSQSVFSNNCMVEAEGKRGVAEVAYNLCVTFLEAGNKLYRSEPE